MKSEVLENMETRWETLIQTQALLLDQWVEGFGKLGKNAMKRVANVVMQYPIKNEQPLPNEIEVEVANVGIKLQETRMAMATIHGAIEELKGEV